jgi:chromosome partitioning protein
MKNDALYCSKNKESEVAKIIAFANQKGGVGKTTSCINVAASLTMAKQKILLVDLDPQGNATMGSGVDKALLINTVNEVLLENVSIEQAIIKNTAGGYDLLPANGNLTSAEVGLINKIGRELKLKQALDQVAHKYNFILLDCPPSLNMLTLNALVAANSIIIPMQCEYYALEGLSALVNTIEQIKRSLNKKLAIEGIILTMFDPRNRLSTDVVAQLKTHFPAKIYKSVIPRNVRLAEAPSHGLPVLFYDKSSRGACAYLDLAAEIIKANRATAKKIVLALEEA